MKKIFLYFLIVLSTGIFFAGCESDEKKTADVNVSDSIINLPSCLSSESVPQSRGGGTGFINDIYGGIRESIGGIELWTGVIKEVIDGVVEITSYGDSGEWTDPANGNIIVWGPGDDQGFVSKVEVFNAAGDQGLQAYLTIDADKEAAKGIIIFNMSVMDANGKDAVLRLDFDGISEPKTLKIQAEGISEGLNSEPANAVIEASLDEDHIIRVSGNFYFPHLDFMNQGLDDSKNYGFTAIGYDEEGAGTGRENMAVLKLAVTPSDLDNIETMFDDYSVGTILKPIMIGYIKKAWDADGLNIAALNFFLIGSGITLGVANVGDLTTDQIIEILEYAASLPSPDAGIAAMLFVLDIVNPAYFNGTGFAGTFDGTNGTLGAIPEGFDGLDIKTVEPIVPADVTSLVLEFL